MPLTSKATLYLEGYNLAKKDGLSEEDAEIYSHGYATAYIHHLTDDDFAMHYLKGFKLATQEGKEYKDAKEYAFVYAKNKLKKQTDNTTAHADLTKNHHDKDGDDDSDSSNPPGGGSGVQKGAKHNVNPKHYSGSTPQNGYDPEHNPAAPDDALDTYLDTSSKSTENSTLSAQYVFDDTFDLTKQTLHGSLLELQSF